MSLAAEYQVPKALEEWARNAEITNLAQLFRKTVEKVGTRPYVGQKVAGEYRFQTYNEVRDRIHWFASALIDLGLQPGDRVASFSNNRPEWVMTDQGAFHGACVHVPMYATLSAGDVAYILQDSGARVVVTATEEHTKKVLEIEGECPDLEHIVAVEAVSGTSAKRLWSWSEFMDHGKSKLSAHSEELEKRVAGLKASDVCSLVYTSGTTGRPKGAMLMHGNFVSNATTVVPVLGAGPEDVELSFLPLSHVFERIAYYAMTLAGSSIGYAEAIETVPANLLELRPTIVPSVPRLFEKIHARVMEQASHGIKKSLFGWALGVGRAYREAKLKGDVPGGIKFQHGLAHKLVFSKIHARTGGRVRYFISGGAPLRRDVGEFFLDAGFTILEGYGLTETSPVITMNPPQEPRIGTVGKVIEHCECKIADDGEILARGPNIMKGYFNKPEATAEAIDADGWFHTGDIGRFDPDGYLMITDRKKELLVMSNGKNVAPQPLEQAIKGSPWIEMAVVIGDNRNFISALVVPSFERLIPWAKEQGLPTAHAELVATQKVHDLMWKETQAAVKEFSGYEQPKKITVLPRELTMDDGELTPTLKVKRRVVNEHFAEQIEAMYAGG